MREQYTYVGEEHGARAQLQGVFLNTLMIMQYLQGKHLLIGSVPQVIPRCPGCMRRSSTVRALRLGCLCRPSSSRPQSWLWRGRS